MSDNAGRADPEAEESRSTTADRLLSRSPVVLHLAVRIGLGVLGLALLASAVASLRRENELGTVAVCLVGAAMVLVGAMGRWPSRISWGDRSAEWAEEVLERAVESGSDETRAEIVQAARSVDPMVHFLTAASTTSNALGDALTSLIGATPPSAAIDPVPVRDAAGVRPDLAIRSEPSADRAHTVAVEVEDTRGGRRMAGLVPQAQRILESGYGAVLILTDLSADKTRDSLNLTDHDGPVFIGSYRDSRAFETRWRDPTAGPEELRETIRQALDFVGRSATR